MTKENKQNKKSIKYILSILTLLFIMFNTIVLATSNETILPTNDVTPPRGKLEIKGSYVVNDITYVETNEIEVEIIAKDDSERRNKILY